MPRYRRPTLISAVEYLGTLSQAKFNQLILRLGLEGEVPSETTVSVAQKCALLARIVAERPESQIETEAGTTELGDAVICEATRIARPVAPELQVPFTRALARDGYTIVWNDDEQPILRTAFPEAFGVAEADDEVHELLRTFRLTTPMGHLDQAIGAHTRGEWASANGQLRTFVESLFDDIERLLRPSDADDPGSAETRRAALAQIGFFAVDLNEWTRDGKNYINGLMKLLHTTGSHPGLSDEDHCTFRLHVVLITARMFLRRLQERWE